MRFGVREICDVVFKPLTSVDIAGQHFDAGQPVLYLDTAKTSSLEGTATTVYAQGGKGNPRLIGWDGEKVITFTVEDALMSPVSFAMLSGAGVIKGSDDKPVYVHTTYDLVVEGNKTDGYYAELSYAERNGADIVVSKEAPVYPVILDNAGAQAAFISAVLPEQITPQPEEGTGIVTSDGAIRFNLKADTENKESSDYELDALKAGATVRIDCYTVHKKGAYEMEIEAGTFAGYYYIEASTLFRDEATGVDMPAEFIIPRGKISLTSPLAWLLLVTHLPLLSPLTHSLLILSLISRRRLWLFFRLSSHRLILTIILIQLLLVTEDVTLMKTSTSGIHSPSLKSQRGNSSR